MMPASALTLTEELHARLKRHLFPGDGKEAAAILVCSKVPGERLRLLAQDVVFVPHERCSTRDEVSLSWPSEYIENAIDLAARRQLSVVLVHSHPSGYPAFSDIDDRSDREVIPCIFEACGQLHGTAVMLPTGVMFGRVYTQQLVTAPIELVSVVGPDLHYWWSHDAERNIARPMAFTSAMTNELGRLTACVIGVSGTGSIVAEQLCRLGFGKVILVDHDKVEGKNLNRILNTVKADADGKRYKVEVFADRVNAYRDKPYAVPIEANVLTRQAVISAAQSDVLFCCVDTHRGRSVADRLSAAFLLPLFDVGVAIPTRDISDGTKAIDEATGRIDYVYPSGSSLFDRGVYTAATLQAEDLAETDPDAHADQVKRGYIEDVPEQAPSVITLNMRAASSCVMEFIARAYPFRHESNTRYARTRFMLAEGIEEFTAEHEFEARVWSGLASGDLEPLLGLPVLAKRRKT
ncbi:ThiF family adenylyltransferase [Burkholderia pseudomallei]|uniref:ThiF family adenylyltransferase n=1 Tax=Burkholderia pseudomallei TaxID=28450 RepID=UPI001AD64A5E|nr:ThiF family adenylyltransferase [Burkholderia pseudomallei]MBO7832529.1 ThiF family adenylyltransferase [Burkholderia pseudomallei]MBO7850984.1 ThiF family adenylyltransferase [Burkholderia pseudomallei]